MEVNHRQNADSWLVHRTVVCAATIGSGFAPILHKLVTEGGSGLEKFPMMPLGITMACYFLGAMVYVARIPEKYWQGLFDIWVRALSKAILFQQAAFVY